jgi:hypothetical protein
LRGIDILRPQFTDTVALLAGFSERNQRICAQTDAGLFAIEAIFEIPDT